MKIDFFDIWRRIGEADGLIRVLKLGEDDPKSKQLKESKDILNRIKTNNKEFFETCEQCQKVTAGLTREFEQVIEEKKESLLRLIELAISISLRIIEDETSLQV